MTNLEAVSPKQASIHATSISAMAGLPGPIAVGGMGGSGTRVVAQILQKFGCYIGETLNFAKDNVWFQKLLIYPQWYRNASNEELTHRLSLFDRAMHNDLSWGDIPGTLRVARALMQSNPTVPRPGQRPRSSYTRSWRQLEYIPGMMKPVNFAPYRVWGWKMPGSIFYLPLLAEYYPDMKFVLVMRHGLDMAYSTMQGQPVYWSWLYQLPPTVYPVPPQHMLAFWVKANQTAIQIGEEKLKDRFLALNFDRLCLSPETEVDRLIEFFKLHVSDETRSEMIALPRPPKSMGRYKEADSSIFAPQDVEAVRQLGFPVEI